MLWQRQRSFGWTYEDIGMPHEALNLHDHPRPQPLLDCLDFVRVDLKLPSAYDQAEVDEGLFPDLALLLVDLHLVFL